VLAQTRFAGFTPSGSNPWYDSTHPAQSRARAYYAYDPTLGLKASSSFYAQTAGSPTTWIQARQETYGYDPQLDYLTSANYGDGLTNANPTWTYDAAGNRTDSVCDNLNRTISVAGTPVTCDILGNRTAFGSSASYSWDCLNRMTGLTGSGTTSSYEYRADSMRTHKIVGSVNTEYYHDAQMPMEDAVLNGASVTATRYGLGARGVEYEEEGIATTSTRQTMLFPNVGFPLYDTHGNMIATLARSGVGSYTVNNQRSYDAWGSIRIGTSAGDPKNRYCASLGHQQDDELGLIYMRARYYEPASGRFVSQDPELSGANWFAYCQGDPINYFDSSGKALSAYQNWLWVGLFFTILAAEALKKSLIAGLVLLTIACSACAKALSESGKIDKAVQAFIWGTGAAATLTGVAQNLKLLSEDQRTELMGTIVTAYTLEIVAALAYCAVG